MARSNSSVLWEFFEKVNALEKKAKCNTCGETYSFKASTANLKTHLKRKHIDAYERVSNAQRGRVPLPIVQIEEVPTTEQIAVVVTDNATTSTAEITGTNNYTSVHRAARPQQQRMDRYGSTKKISQETKRKIDIDLLDLFIDSYQPFSLVEERAFKKFASWIPGYELPSRKTVSNIMIPTLYNATVEKKTSELSDVEHICLTTDLWTSRVNDSYIAVTGHYITEDLQLKSVLLKCDQFQDAHSSGNIKTALLNITGEWNLTSKVNFVLTDNAANVKKAVADIGWKHYGCFGHTLNLIVQDSLKLVNVHVDKIKAVVRHFKTSSTALEKLLKAQAQDKPDEIPKRLIQDVPTRWNSTFHMIRRFVELESYICTTIAVLRRDLPIITNEEWMLFSELSQVLKPFDEATEAMSGEKYMTASSIIVMTRCLLNSSEKLLLERFLPTTKDVILKLKDGLETRLGDVEKSGTFAVATFLDPRYKTTVFMDANEATKTRKKVEDLVAQTINRQTRLNTSNSAMTSAPTTVLDKFSPWSILNTIVGTQNIVGTPLSRAIREIDSYLKDDTLPVFNERGKFNCPLEWWRLNKHLYPNMAILLKQYANVVATSVPCERIFSKTGLTISERRTRLSTRKVAQLAFLNVNLDSSRFNKV